MQSAGMEQQESCGGVVPLYIPAWRRPPVYVPSHNHAAPPHQSFEATSSNALLELLSGNACVSRPVCDESPVSPPPARSRPLPTLFSLESPAKAPKPVRLSVSDVVGVDMGAGDAGRRRRRRRSAVSRVAVADGAQLSALRKQLGLDVDAMAPTQVGTGSESRVKTKARRQKRRHKQQSAQNRDRDGNTKRKKKVQVKHKQKKKVKKKSKVGL